jgi:hypothetical protein
VEYLTQRKEGKTMNIKLYHYSNKNFEGYIKPSFFGYNNYSNNSKRISLVKRTFFYLSKNEKEDFFNIADYCYIAKINKNCLYDIEVDKNNILPFLEGQDVYAVLKAKGYKGIRGNNGCDIICLFDDVKIDKKISLRSEVL